MVIPGSDLIISADGMVLAVAKSCSVDVDAEVIKVSDPDDGVWEHKRGGRKSWGLTTNHMLPNIMSRYPLVKVNSIGWYQDGESSITFQGLTRTFNTRGIHVVRYYYEDSVWKADVWNYDPIGDEGDIADFITDCASGFSAADGDIIAMCTVDAYVLNASMKSAIATNLHVPADQIPLCTLHGAMAIIGALNNGAEGICIAGVGMAAIAHAKAYYFDGNVRSLATPVKTFLQKVGQSFTLQLLLDGFGNDSMRGTAICKSAKIQATKGNLLTGSFQFEGDGPLV